MPINDEVWGAPAIRGDISYAVLQTMTAIRLITGCLAALEAGKPLPEGSLDRLAELSGELEKHWDKLVGWQDNEK